MGTRKLWPGSSEWPCVCFGCSDSRTGRIQVLAPFLTRRGVLGPFLNFPELYFLIGEMATSKVATHCIEASVAAHAWPGARTPESQGAVAAASVSLQLPAVCTSLLLPPLCPFTAYGGLRPQGLSVISEMSVTPRVCSLWRGLCSWFDLVPV